MREEHIFEARGFSARGFIRDRTKVELFIIFFMNDK